MGGGEGRLFEGGVYSGGTLIRGFAVFSVFEKVMSFRKCYYVLPRRSDTVQCPISSLTLYSSSVVSKTFGGTA